MITDKAAIIRQVVFWVQLGWHDIISRYRSTVLGVFWIVLVNSFTVFAIGLVYGSLFRINLQEYLPYLATGYIIWLWISTSILEISSAFTSYRFILLSHAVNPVAIVMRIYARNFFVFLHNIPIIILVLLIYIDSWTTTWLLFPLGLLIVSLLLIGMGGAIAFFCARFHDVQMIISAIVGVLFLVTPIIWSPDILQERAYIATINPLRHILDILRKPLLGEVPSLLNYTISLAMCLIGILLFWIVYRFCKKRYIYWL